MKWCQPPSEQPARISYRARYPRRLKLSELKSFVDDLPVLYICSMCKQISKCAMNGLPQCNKRNNPRNSPTKMD